MIVAGASISPVLLLYWQYRNDATPVINPFERNLVRGVLNEMRAVDLQYDSYYFAGSAEGEIYLGNSLMPRSLFVLQIDTGTVKQKVLTGWTTPIRASKMRVDSPFVFIEDLVSYKILQADLEALKITAMPFDSIFFSEAIPLNSNSIIRRTFGDTSQEYILTKECISPDNTTKSYDLLQKQIDGLFCTDGMLHYDQTTARLTYVYFYRNQFFCADTSLNLLFRGNTIDTITRAKIKVARIKSENSITLAGPPAIVNRRSCVFQHWLFNNSSLMGKNEQLNEFNNVSVIDVYDLDNNGKYLASFYLPNYKGHKMKVFVVFQNKLIAIHGQYLVSYTINRNQFN